MKNKILLIGLLIISYATQPIFSLSDHPLTLQSKFQTDTLFMQQASSATLKQDPSVPGQYQLCLRGLYPRIIYLTAESRHKAGVIPLQTFLKNWQRQEVLFRDDGPSAILSYLSFKPSTQSGIETDVLELSKPVYNRSSNSIVFIAKTSHNQPIKTGRFKNVVLIYDGLNFPNDKLNSEYKVMANPHSLREVLHHSSQ